MIEAPLISIIIPVYNTEQFLEKCFESVLRQTFADFEAIVVDDGSTDGSAAACEDFARRDGRVRVVRQENGGLSCARNAGVDAAAGEYIAFLDSDDFLHPRFLELLYGDAVAADADIAVCGYVRGEPEYEFPGVSRAGANAPFAHEGGSRPTDGGGCLTPAAPASTAEVVTGETAFKRLLSGRSNSGGVVSWNKLYKAELFRDVRFPEGRVFEDAATTYILYYKAGRVSLRPDELYCYVRRPGSIVSGGLSPLSMQRLDAGREALAFVAAHRPELLDYARCYSLIAAMRLMAEIMDAGARIHAEEAAVVRGVIRDQSKSLDRRKRRVVSTRHRVLLLLLRVCPALYRRLYRRR